MNYLEWVQTITWLQGMWFSSKPVENGSNVSRIWGNFWGKLCAKSKIPTVGWYEGMKHIQYTKFFKFLIPWEFLWNEPILWDGNRVFLFVAHESLLPVGPKWDDCSNFFVFLARVAIFLTRFQKKTSLNLNTPFEVSSTLPETHSSPLKNGGRWETTFILGCHG